MHLRLINTLLLIALSLNCINCSPSKPQVKEKVLRLSIEDEPSTLDPRQARTLTTATALHVLYEGLFRAQGGQTPELALAQSYTLSPDGKTYTFKLRPSQWSNGDPVTATDFEETWKSILSPSYAAPNAYQLYMIKNAQQAKEGKISLDQVGIHAIDPTTLVVVLENPTPYFLELLSTYFYYPVAKSTRLQTHAPIDPITTVTNGPYRISEWEKKELTAVPNPHYWDRRSVKLDKITFVLLDNSTAYQIYQKNGLERTGSPLTTLPVDALQFLKQKKELQVKPSAGVHLFRINTEKAPFNNVKLRRAFAYALNRQELVEHVLQGNQLPAMGVVPPSDLKSSPLFKDHALELARRLFQEYLTENKITAKDVPIITISYASGEREHKIAQVVQQQWKEAFGIEPQLKIIESKVYYTQIKNFDYQLGIGSWYADFRDPISFLEVFKYKDNGTNNTQWQNPDYIRLLDQSALTQDPEKRKEILLSAEKVLMDDMPIIPLFFNAYNYLQKPEVKGVYFSELGYLDLKKADIDL